MIKYDMTSMERVMAVIKNEEYDIVPAINPTSVVNFQSMKMKNAYFPSAHTNVYDMVNLASVGHDYYGFDSVAPYFSVHLEAEALGAEIDWDNNKNMPKVVKQSISNIEDFSLPEAFIKKKDFQKLLKAIRELKRKYKREVPVIGKVVGPWTLAYNLYGVENLILDTILEPEKTKKLIAELSKVSIEFAKAQFDAGADIVTWAEHVTSDLVSPQIYKNFVLPVHKSAMFTLEKYGPVILHVCGNVEDRIGYFAEAGFKIFHIDSRNNIKNIYKVIEDKMILTGCVNNPVTLAQGSPSLVRKEVEKNICDGIRLIAPECAIPFNVSENNLKELVKTTHHYKYSDISKI